MTMKYNYDDYLARRKDIEVLIESSFEYADLDDFLSDVVLEKSQKENENVNEDYVVITTIHKAKGLEYYNFQIR